VSGATTVETLVRRDRAIVAAGLVAIAALAWLWLLRLSGSMTEMAEHMAMPDMGPWSAGEAAGLFVMWAVMMVAMMTPSAAPMVLVFAAVNRRRREQGGVVVPTGVFVLGYVVVWSLYAVAAAAGQWALHNVALLSEEMAAASPLLGGILLLAAGVFQWTPLKRACLAACRSPLSFVMTRWHEGARGAFVMGLSHGVYCVGCCWVLMALLFVAGVMNLAWVAAIGAFTLAEKALPWGDALGRAAGVVLAGAGLLLVTGVTTF